jgi:hypothetical protein
MAAKKKTWHQHIADAKANKGVFSLAARAKANRWPTCAVGENVPQLASFEIGMSQFRDTRGAVGVVIESLGYAFNHAVQQGKPYSAAQLYKVIKKLIRDSAA